MSRTARILVIIGIIALSGWFMLPPAHAALDDLWRGGYWGDMPPLIPCTGAGDTTTGYARPPCVSLCNLIETFVHLLYFGMTIALYVVTPLLFAWGGFNILIAGGSPDKLQAGKRTIAGALVGILIVLAAYLIIDQIYNAFLLSSDVPGTGGTWANPVCPVGDVIDPNFFNTPSGAGGS